MGFEPTTSRLDLTHALPTELLGSRTGLIAQFSFCFIKALDLKGILNTIKKCIMSAMECPDLAAFTFAMSHITLYILCKIFARNDGH